MTRSRVLIVSADDIGLSRGNTDSILACIDEGVLTNVSILPNGPAFEYAIQELSHRTSLSTISAHLNLTEGRPLLPRDEVSMLVGSDGVFLGVGGLVTAYMLSSRKRRIILREQISRELLAQIKRVLNSGCTDGALWVDGHQHVHMLPFVFEELVRLKTLVPIAHIRIPNEPFSIHWPFSYSVQHLWTHTLMGGYILAFLGAYGRRLAAHANIATNRWFVGVRYSGRMSADAATSGLRAVVAELGEGETEILFHSGESSSGETLEWSGDCNWHSSPWRAKERAYVTSTDAQKLFEVFRMGLLPAGPNLDKMLRYGISGGLAAFTHLGALYLFTDIVGMWFVEANVVAFCLGLIVSFSMQKLWTFGDRHVDGVHHQAFWYALVQVVSLCVNTALLYVLVTYAGWWYLGSQFLLLALIAVGNFFIFNKVIFKHHGDS